MDEDERAFLDACVREGMDEMSYCIQAAVRAYRSHRAQKPKVAEHSAMCRLRWRHCLRCTCGGVR